MGTLYGEVTIGQQDDEDPNAQARRSAGARLARRSWMRAAWFLDRRLQGTGGRLHWPDDMRSACHTWIQLIVEMDEAFDRSWPYDVAHAIRHVHTIWEAKDRLAKLDRFAGREKQS